MVAKTVRRTLEHLPSSPGVYIFRGTDSKVLYVGKARNLRSRVRSYFQPRSSDMRLFISYLDKELVSIETVITYSDKEAVLLENELIKFHQPRYNVKLRDDKDFLSMRLDSKKKWPRLEIVRRPKPDGARYFGPYHSATAARQTLRLVNRHFQLRTCTDTEFKMRSRPCLQYQIKQCPGPCVLPVDPDEYANQVTSVIHFLDGRHDKLIQAIKARMHRASSAMEYEQASIYRNQLKAVERAREGQRIASVQKTDQDVIGFHREDHQVEIALLKMRSGRLFAVQTFALKRVAVPDDEMLGAFLRQYYGDRILLPDEILIPHPIEMSEALEAWLSESRRRIYVRIPQRGAKVKLLHLARENAEHAFAERARSADETSTRLQELQRKLKLKKTPHTIECIDVSHTGGSETVAVFVRLCEGKLERERYRSFHVNNIHGGDDYASMYEVLLRRLRRGGNKQIGWELPDMLVVDGGKGQLGIAERACAKLKIHGLELASVAKPRITTIGKVETNRIFRPDQKNPIPVRPHSALALLLIVRDEAHRASNDLRKKLGRKRRLRSELDQVPGIGPKTRTNLLKTLGSLRNVIVASEQQLVQAGATRSQAKAIVTTLRPRHDFSEEMENAEKTAVDSAFQSN